MWKQLLFPHELYGICATQLLSQFAPSVVYAFRGPTFFAPPLAPPNSLKVSTVDTALCAE